MATVVTEKQVISQSDDEYREAKYFMNVLSRSATKASVYKTNAWSGERHSLLYHVSFRKVLFYLKI